MSDAEAEVVRAAKESYGRLLAYLAVRTRDVAAAEDALAEAFTKALERWPERGVPHNPDGWLLTVARNQLRDRARHAEVQRRAEPTLAMIADEFEARPADQRLELLFVCAHPAIDRAVRTPLMLQTVLGLDAKAIAEAFLVTPASMAKRLVRAKKKIKEAGISFALPERSEWAPRLRAVLDAVYAAYGRSWNLALPPDPRTEELRTDAIYLAEVIARALPDEAEAHGLLALLLHCEARAEARVRDGVFVPLDAQDVALWDRALQAKAEAALRQASTHATLDRYQLEAALQSAHVARRRSGQDNWAHVHILYETLLAKAPSVGAELAYVAALAASGDAAGALARLDARFERGAPAPAGLLGASGRAAPPPRRRAFGARGLRTRARGDAGCRDEALARGPAGRAWLSPRSFSPCRVHHRRAGASGG